MNLDDIDIDQNLQMRATTAEDVIEEYAEAVDDLPPVTIITSSLEGKDSWFLVDGFHRFAAHRKAGRTEIKASFTLGQYDDALLFAMSANYKNGMRPSDADKQRSIKRLLKSAIVEQWMDSPHKLSTKRMAEATGIPKRSVERYTKEFRDLLEEKRNNKIIESHQLGKSNVAIAFELGIGEATVRRFLSSLPPVTQTTNTVKADSTMPFSDDELDGTPVVNPYNIEQAPAIPQAQAFQNELDRHEAEHEQSQDKASAIRPTDESHLIGLLNQLRAIRNGDTYKQQLEALVSNEGDYVQKLIAVAQEFKADLKADGEKPKSSSEQIGKRQPWSWTSVAADTLEEAFTDRSLHEMVTLLQQDEHALKEFNRVSNYMQRVASLLEKPSEVMV